MTKQKIFYYVLFGLWQSLAVAVEFDSSLTATSQWMINTRNGDSQSLNLSLVPELNADFDNGWQLFTGCNFGFDTLAKIMLYTV